MASEHDSAPPTPPQAPSRADDDAQVTRPPPIPPAILRRSSAPPPIPASEAPPPPIGARFRFQTPSKFLQFHERQLGRGVLGLRHSEPVEVGHPVQVIISPPGAPDRLLIDGRTAAITAKPDGSVRLRIQIELSPTDQAWLEAYLIGLRAAMAHPRPASMPPPQLPDPEPEEPPLPDPTAEQVFALVEHLDRVSYFELLELPNDVSPDDLQIRYHALTRIYHPELVPHDAPLKLRRAFGAVYRRMNEAYGVLRDPQRRTRYEAGLHGNEPALRFREEDEHQVQRMSRGRGGVTKAGDYYWSLARAVLKEARGLGANKRPALLEASRLVRLAMAFEPDNQHFGNALHQINEGLRG